MSSTLEVRAEITKLARLLESDPATLAYLERVAPDDLSRLREQTTDMLFDASRGALQRMAAASRVIPVPLLAKIAEGIFGPLLCARIAGMIEPSRAADVATRLTPAFLADVAVALDPRRATDVIGRIPVAETVAITRELLARDEFVTMGRFVGHLSDDALRAAIELSDEAELLRIAFVLEGKERLDHVLALLSRERMAKIVTIAEREHLWPEVLDLLRHVSAERHRELVDVAAEQDDALLTGLVRAVDAQRLWPVLLPTLRSISDESRKRFATLAAGLDSAVLEHAIDAAVQCSLWSPLIALAAAMDDAGRRRVAELIVSASDEVVRSVSEEVLADGLWRELLVIASQLHRAPTDRLVLRVSELIDLSEDDRRELAAHAAELDLEDELAPLTRIVPQH